MESKLPPENSPDAGVPPSALRSALSGRSFAFYPPVRGFDRNEWEFIRETWAETLVRNTGADTEVWIPRRAIGAISSVEEPVAIVGLAQEFEYRAGSVWPYRSRVLEMPSGKAATVEGPKASRDMTSVLPKGAGYRTESRVARLIGISVVVAVAGIVLLLGVFRGDGLFGRRLALQAGDQDYLSLSAGDDYYSVLQKLGRPDSDRWSPQTKEVAFRVLAYEHRAYHVVLFGAEPASVTYLGVLDNNWRPIHAVPVGKGVDSTALLKSLRRF